MKLFKIFNSLFVVFCLLSCSAESLSSNPTSAQSAQNVPVQTVQKEPPVNIGTIVCKVFQSEEGKKVEIFSRDYILTWVNSPIAKPTYMDGKGFLADGIVSGSITKSVFKTQERIGKEFNVEIETAKFTHCIFQPNSNYKKEMGNYGSRHQGDYRR